MQHFFFLLSLPLDVHNRYHAKSSPKEKPSTCVGLGGGGKLSFSNITLLIHIKCYEEVGVFEAEESIITIFLMFTKWRGIAHLVYDSPPIYSAFENVEHFQYFTVHVYLNTWKSHIYQVFKIPIYHKRYQWNLQVLRVIYGEMMIMYKKLQIWVFELL